MAIQNGRSIVAKAMGRLVRVKCVCDMKAAARHDLHYTLILWNAKIIKRVVILSNILRVTMGAY